MEENYEQIQNKNISQSGGETAGSGSDTLEDELIDDNQSSTEHWADQIFSLMENPLKKSTSGKYRLQSLYNAGQKILNQYQKIKKGQQKVMKIKTDKIKKIKNALKFEKLKLKKRMHTQNFKKFRDKIGFTAGVFNLIISAYLMGENVQWLYYWYSVSCFFTILIRFYRYIKTNEQYFYLDFCYFANIIIILFFNFFRDNETLFSIVFAFTMGPLLLAIPSFRSNNTSTYILFQIDSFVFHSLDRLTSLKIHLAPALALYCYRWKDKTVEDVFSKQSFTFSYFFFTFGKAFSLYLCWAIIHYVSVFWILKQRDRDKKYITTFDYMTKNPKSWKCKATYRFGKNLKVAGLIYIFINICFNFIAIAFAVIQFRFFYLNFFYLIFCLYISVWNGASFYIEYFSRKYEQSIKDFENMYEKLDDQEFQQLLKVLEQQNENSPQKQQNKMHSQISKEKEL